MDTAPSDARPERVAPHTRVLYGLADWGPATATAAFLFFFSYFLTDVARVAPAYAAPILLIGGVWQAANVPLVGALSDRTRTRWGRRRPYLLFGALPFALACAALWSTPLWGAGARGRAAYYLLAYVAYDTALSFVAVPYAALTPDLAPGYDERTRLNAYRVAVVIVGGAVTAVGAPALVAAARDPAQGYRLLGATLGVLGAVPFLLLFAAVRERVATPARERVPPAMRPGALVRELRDALSGATARYTAAVVSLTGAVVGVTASTFEYYATYCLGLHAELPLLLGLVQASSLAAVPVVAALCERRSKRFALALGSAWFAVVAATLAFVPARPPPALAYGLAVLIGPGLATAQVVPWAMVPDALDADELASGRRREGLFYGLLVLLQRTATSAALAGVQAALALTGYVAGSAQPPRALLAIRAVIGPLPVLLLVATVLLARRHPVSREAHAALQLALAARRAERRRGAGPAAATATLEA